MARYLYSELSSLIQARLNCQDHHNQEWFQNHSRSIEKLVYDWLPSGAGFDNGTTLNLEESHAEKLVFHTSFHHMNDCGVYDGWTVHTIVATPSFLHGVNLRVSGHNRNHIKDHIYECFYAALIRTVNISAM